MVKPLALALSVALISCLNGPAAAQVTVAVPIQSWVNAGAGSSAVSSQTSNQFWRVEPTAELRLSNVVSLQTTTVFEQVLDPPRGGFSISDRHGMFVEELKAVVELGGVTLSGGKFNPNFGIAWDLAPGINGIFVPEGYEIAEKIGFAFSYATSSVASSPTISASLFFADTSVLTESIFTNRGRTSLADGGASNTESLKSFTVSVDGTLGLDQGDLSYHAGLRYFARPEVDPMAEAETGIAAGLSYMPSDQALPVSLLFEVVYLNDPDGAAGKAVYTTGGAEWAFSPAWTLGSTYTRRQIDLVGAGPTTDHAFDMAVGHKFENDVEVQVGYYRLWQSGSTENFISSRLAKEFEWSF